jgi:DNA-binding transcriptional LysR family regulator
MMRMELRELRYFVAVAEELHFARAAARIGIEQSPLSKAIAELERHLGTQLFIRTRRSTQLTSAGEVLLQDAQRIFAAVNQAHHNIRSADSGRRGRLRVAVSDGLACFRIARLLTESRRDDPDVNIELVHSPLQKQLKELYSGALDIGLSLAPSNDPRLRSTPLWTDAIAVVMRADNPLAAQHVVRYVNTTGALIVLGEDGSNRDIESLIAGCLPPEPRHETIEYAANTEMLLTLVAAGYGIGLMSAAAAETTRWPDLVVRPLSPRKSTITTFLVQRANDSSNLVLRFIERARNLT